MITFSSLGAATVRCEYDKKILVVFPDAGAKVDADLKLLASPEEQPTDGALSWPGEYDIDGIAIRGIGHDEGKYVSYVVEMNGTRCAFLCSPLHDFTDYELEILGDVDVLCIPTDDPKIIQKLVDEIDPRVLIPLDTGGADKHAEALKICGAQGVEAVAEHKVKGLPAEGREVVVLQS